MAKKLKKYKGIDFLNECYEAEHTVSLNDATAGLKTFDLNGNYYISVKGDVYKYKISLEEHK